MNRTKIEWVRNPDGTQGYSSNPISGLCPVQCKLPDGRAYCYGKNYYYRFKRDKQLMFWMHKLDKIRKRKKPAGIFMCSTFELFHDCTKGFYRDAIFDYIRACTQHRFYILTKFPQNIDRPMPDNVWLGVTITNENKDEDRKLVFLKEAQAKLKFISFEPLFGENKLLPDDTFLNLWFLDVKWIIIGRLTGYGNKYNPSKSLINLIIRWAKDYNIPIFLKDNLKEIWGEPLIQEFPSEN